MSGLVLFNHRGSHCTYHRQDGRLLTTVCPHGGRKTCQPEDIRKIIEALGPMRTHHEYGGYVFSITCQPQHSAYTVEFPDFRYIIRSGDSLAEAFVHACEALDLHLESMAKLNIRAPKPMRRLVLKTA